jgi:beta-mannosidase
MVKDLGRQRPELSVATAAHGEREVLVTVQAPAHAYFVHIETPSPTARFSDNYFDLDAGEKRTIRVEDEAPLSTESIRVAWR